MTADKNRKRLVRARMRRTGESYTAALRHLRDRSVEEPVMPETAWRRIEKPEFGYAVSVPEEWTERPPNLSNSPWETARFAPAGDARRGLILFRMPLFRQRSPLGIATTTQASLAGAGFDEFSIGELTVAGGDGARLDCARRDTGRVWAVREYFVVSGDASLCLGLGSAVPDEDAALFDDLAARWEIIPLDPAPAGP